ncbi:hypothetical protein ACSE3M_10985 [Bacillus velezensis]
MFKNGHTFIYSADEACAPKYVFFSCSGTSQWRCLFDEAKSVYQSLLSIDMTEITGLDDLHHPTGVIKEAQGLVSRLYGSQESFFLVNGTTARQSGDDFSCL